jgi:hypothetical protein
MFRGPPLHSANDPVRPRQLIPDRPPGLADQALTSVGARRRLSRRPPSLTNEPRSERFSVTAKFLVESGNAPEPGIRRSSSCGCRAGRAS